jgi:hypothetical protein
MTYVTLDQAAERIVHRITREPVRLRTLQRWVQQHPEAAEKRFVRGRRQTHYLQETDLEALLAYFPDYELLPAGTAPALSPVTTLALKVQQFESDIAELRRVILAELRRSGEAVTSRYATHVVSSERPEATHAAEATDHLIAPARRVLAHPLSATEDATSRPPPLPGGWVSYSAICKMHRVDKRTVDTYFPKLFGIQGRDIAHQGPFRLPNTQVAWALDEAQQRWILAVFQAYEQFKGFQECTIPTCYCHSVDITLASLPPPLPQERSEQSEVAPDE